MWHEGRGCIFPRPAWPAGHWLRERQGEMFGIPNEVLSHLWLKEVAMVKQYPQRHVSTWRNKKKAYRDSQFRAECWGCDTAWECSPVYLEWGPWVLIGFTWDGSFTSTDKRTLKEKKWWKVDQSCRIYVAGFFHSEKILLCKNLHWDELLMLKVHLAADVNRACT